MIDQVARLVVLVVDDDDLVRTAMALELEDRGYGVLEAGSGPQALELLKGDHPVKAVVIDLNMPTLGGLALMTVIKADWPRLPIIATSGADPAETLPQGVIFLQKPHRPGQLHAAVQVAVLAEEYGLGS